MKRFLEWWVLFLLQISSIGIFYYFDLINWMWNNDATKLSFVIVAIWFVMTIKCGIHAIQYDRFAITSKKLNSKLESGWFASDQCLSIGMLGTVIGFLLMMSSLSMENSDVNSIKAMLKTMSSGMSTALITTAVGMIFSNLLKLQIFLVSRET